MDDPMIWSGPEQLGAPPEKLVPSDLRLMATPLHMTLISKC